MAQLAQLTVQFVDQANELDGEQEELPFAAKSNSFQGRQTTNTSKKPQETVDHPKQLLFIANLNHYNADGAYEAGRKTQEL